VLRAELARLRNGSGQVAHHRLEPASSRSASRRSSARVGQRRPEASSQSQARNEGPRPSRMPTRAADRRCSGSKLQRQSRKPGAVLWDRTRSRSADTASDRSLRGVKQSVFSAGGRGWNEDFGTATRDQYLSRARTMRHQSLESSFIRKCRAALHIRHRNTVSGAVSTRAHSSRDLGS
jgi:hypothetical protein